MNVGSKNSTMKPSVEIIPAILPHSLLDLQEHIDLLQGVAPRVQVDVVDGSYAKGKTWPYRDRSTFDKLLFDEHGLPSWDKLDYQFDLMIEDPTAEVLNFVTVGATQLVLHAKSKTTGEALQALVDRRDQMGTFAVSAGIALDIHAQLDELEPFESQFDFVQIMGIEHEGKQGQAFDKHAVFLVERVRSRYPYVPIQVDGGVTLEHVKPLVEAGANRLVVGSAIFGASDAVSAYHALYTEANG